MAYTPTGWVDRAVATPNKYTKSGETSTSVTLIQDPGAVTQTGTPINATNMNKMEQGIQAAASTADTAISNLSTHAALSNAHNATTTATASRLMIRDASGRSQATDPSAAADVATKGYVDSMIAVGTYTGNGVGVRSIALGFTPKYLIVLLENITTTVGSTTPSATTGRAETVNGGTGIVTWNGMYVMIIDSSATLSIVSNGFYVSNSAADYQIKQFNCAGSVYRYIAYK
jgi:hypothetical protein